MKFVVSKAELVSLISKIQSLISSKPAIQVISNVLIEAVDGQIILSATDLTTSMKCSTEAKIVEEGALALPARPFFQLVKELTTPQVKISTSNNIAEIISGSSVFKINGLPKNEFPTIPEFSGSSQLTLPSNKLKKLLSRTSFCVAKDDSRYVLNGILLKIVNKKASFIGTDGKRIAKTDTDVDLDSSFQGTYILPLKAVEEMIKSLDDSESMVSLGLMPDKVFLENSNSVLMTKLLSGQYPEVEKVIPNLESPKIILHREELISLLKQISLFTSDMSSSVKFTFTNGQLDLTANSSDLGEGIVNMPVDYQGEKMDIAFNPYYFIDMLRHSKDETVNFIILDSYNPGVMLDSTSAVFVIMPMRLSENVESDNVDDTTKAALT